MSYDNVTEENLKEHNPNWSQILDYTEYQHLEVLDLEKQLCYLI